MNIKIIKNCGGNDFSYSQGDVVAVTKEIADDLIQAEYAVEEAPHPAKPPAKASAKSKDGDIDVKPE